MPSGNAPASAAGRNTAGTVATEERRFQLGRVSDERLRQAVQMLTTEHFTLQGARSTTTAEANGRLTAYLAVVSGALIAIGFIGQVSRLGDAFRVFTLLVLPCLLLVGVATYARMLEGAEEDLHYAVGMNRIRHFFVELVPEIGDYLVESTRDDFAGAIRSSWIHASPWAGFLAVSGVVALVNSVIAGVLAALAAGWLAGVPLDAAVAVGVAAGLLAGGLHWRLGMRSFERRLAQPAPLFPSREP